MKLAMMPYAEVEFIKAELLKKGVIDGGSNAAKEAYQKGVQAAIEQGDRYCPTITLRIRKRLMTILWNVS